MTSKDEIFLNQNFQDAPLKNGGKSQSKLHASSSQKSGCPDVYSCVSVQDFLETFCAWKKKETPGFSVRVMAKRLEMKSHSLLAMYIRGDRTPQPEILKRIADYFGLSRREFEHLLNLLFYHKAKTPGERLRLGELIVKQKSRSDDITLEVDELAIFERWYHIAIMEVIRLKAAPLDPSAIAAALGGSVSTDMISEAIDRLLRTGLISIDEKGNLVKTKSDVKSRSHLTTLAMRSFQKQILARGVSAIDSQPVAERLFISLMIPFDSKDVEDAKDMIAQFIEDFQARFENLDGDSVYNLGSQFFAIAKTGSQTKLRSHMN